MDLRRLAPVIALAAMANLFGATTTEAQAQPQVRRPAPVARPAELNDLRYVDIDGDGRPDELSVYLYEDGGANVTVTTAKSRMASLDVSVNTENPLYGTAKIDGEKGAEILINTNEYEMLVLRWKSGALVAEPLAHASPYVSGKVVTRRLWAYGGDTTSTWLTYRFFTSRGVRYVDAASLSCGDCERTGIFEKVTVVRSRWQAHRWQKVKVTVRRHLTRKQAEARYLNEFSGTTVNR